MTQVTDGTGVNWSQPEVVLWWDGIQLDSREDWNEDWAIVDGAGYHDIQVGGKEFPCCIETIRRNAKVPGPTTEI